MHDVAMIIDFVTNSGHSYWAIQFSHSGARLTTVKVSLSQVRPLIEAGCALTPSARKMMNKHAVEEACDFTTITERKITSTVVIFRPRRVK